MEGDLNARQLSPVGIMRARTLAKLPIARIIFSSVLYYTVKKVRSFPVPRRDVTYQTPSGRE